MKKLLLWLVMVALAVVVLLGGTFAALYAMIDEGDLPQPHPTVQGIELEPIGADWEVPVLGGVVNRPFETLSTLSVQKLGDLGNALPELSLPGWVSRADVTLTAPDGTTAVQGDAAALASHVYTQNGEYRLELKLWQDGASQKPAQADGWYQYRVSFTLNLQPEVKLSASRVPQGGVAAIWITGILDGSTPTLETDLGDVWFRPTQSGYMGYIPVTYNAEGGEHLLRLNCGALSQELSLNVTKVDRPVQQTTFTEDPPGSGEQFRNAIWPLYAQGSSEKLWNGFFAEPCALTVAADYGTIYRDANGSTGRATGITYAAPADTAVTAPQAGIVAYAGDLALTGGTVVIDHGCGVKSYLYGLGTVGVQRGQTVAKGDEVGRTTDAHELIFELRIGSKSVDPASAYLSSSGLLYREDQ